MGNKKFQIKVHNDNMIDFMWYNELNKPALSPPSWLFSPVWLILYVTIIAALVVYMAKSAMQSKTSGYTWYIIQIILNLLWMPAFFILKNIGLALGIIILMDIAVFLTIKNFYYISKFAARLLIPYFIWILFATYLNAAYFILNR